MISLVGERQCDGRGPGGVNVDWSSLISGDEDVISSWSRCEPWADLD